MSRLGTVRCIPLHTAIVGALLIEMYLNYLSRYVAIRVAREEEVVEAVLQQPRGLRDTALDHAHAVGQLLLQGPAQRLGHVRGVLGGLEYDGAAGGDGANERAEGDDVGVVPGAGGGVSSCEGIGEAGRRS